VACPAPSQDVRHDVLLGLGLWCLCAIGTEDRQPWNREAAALGGPRIPKWWGNETSVVEGVEGCRGDEGIDLDRYGFLSKSGV
jgi:hypothetical protein